MLFADFHDLNNVEDRQTIKIVDQYFSHNIYLYSRLYIERIKFVRCQLETLKRPAPPTSNLQTGYLS